MKANLNKFKLVVFLLLISADIYAQNYDSSIFNKWWTRDTNQEYFIDEFDMDYVSFHDSTLTVRYNRNYGCGLAVSKIGDFKLNESDSTVEIHFYDSFFDSINKTWEKETYIKTYKYSIKNSGPIKVSKEYLIHYPKRFYYLYSRIKYIDFYLTLINPENNRRFVYSVNEYYRNRVFVKFDNKFTKYCKRKKRQHNKKKH